jgi:hypothetical protein
MRAMDIVIPAFCRVSWIRRATRSVLIDWSSYRPSPHQQPQFVPYLGACVFTRVILG